VVVVHCEALYESLYDLLNQHYTEFGNKLYVRLAFGTSNRLCEIHPTFRVMVVTEKIDAYNRLAPPLLNRFEKQVSGEAVQELISLLQHFCFKHTNCYTQHTSHTQSPTPPSSFLS
jgi:hypothetical protein